MGNINDAGTLFLQLIYDAKKDFRLPVGQRRGRLIEYQYFGIQGQCLCYLYLLLFRYAELPQPGGRLHLKSHHFQPFSGGLIFLFIVHQMKNSLGRKVGNHNIFSHTPQIKQFQLLMYESDSCPFRLLAVCN